jgi:hypothetical protein
MHFLHKFCHSNVLSFIIANTATFCMKSTVIMYFRCYGLVVHAVAQLVEALHYEQAVRRVRFPMVSSEFFIFIILSVTIEGVRE